jgi:hypothetical protein
MKIRAIAASTFKDHENGWSYSESALKSLAESVKDKPVIYAKEKIGVVESCTYEGEKIIIQAKIFMTEEILGKDLFLVPGGLTDFETDSDIIRECAAHHCFLTEKPSDKDLTPFEIIG